jgi:RNA polymerase sigma-70 factor (ECF subfamily)
MFIAHLALHTSPFGRNIGFSGKIEEQMSDDHSDKPGVSPQEAAHDDERLVRSIAEGDREAEREFALRYLRPVRAMLLARSRNPDLASDLQQEVMIQAICELRRGHLREPAKLTAFVIGIARNLLNSHYRAAARQPQSLDLLNDLPDLSSVSDQAEEVEREKQAMHAISSLGSLDKTILQMTLLDGLKPGIIAERLRLKPEVVRQRKLRATRQVIDFVRCQSQTGSTIHLISGHEQ